MSKKRNIPMSTELLAGVKQPDFTKKETGRLRSFRLDSKEGFMDEHCSVIIPARFNQVGNFVDGLAPAIVDFERDKFGYINKKGEFTIAPQFDSANDFSEDLAAVEVSEKWGYIDISGNIVIPVGFESAQSFSEGLAPVKDNANIPDNVQERKRYIKEYGKSYDIRNRPMVDLYTLRWGYIDKRGNYRIPSQYWSAHIFVDGIAAVQSGPFDKFGFINTEGKFVIDPSFSFACSRRYSGTCKWAVEDTDGIEYAAYEGVTVQDFIQIVKELQKSGKVQDNLGSGWTITKRIEIRTDGNIRIKLIKMYDSTGNQT